MSALLLVGMALAEAGVPAALTQKETAVLEKIQEEAIAWLRDYIRLDTTNPPGRTAEAARYLEKILKKEGFRTEILFSDKKAGKAILIGRWESPQASTKPILLLHHMDVVPADPKMWRHPPFSGKITDGHIWGRGAVDTKGYGTSQLAALIALKRSGARIRRNILYVATCDEEIGGEMGTKWLVENHSEKVDAAFVLDEGGTGFQRTLAADDSIVFGPSVAEKKIVWCRVIAEGPAGHGSMPPKEAAVDRLLAAIADIRRALPAGEPPEMVRQMKKGLGRLADTPFTNSITRNTLSVTSLSAGVGDPPKPNVIPGRAEATLDIRVFPDVSVEDLLRRIGEAAQPHGVKIEILYAPKEETAAAEPAGELFEAIREACVAEVPGARVLPILLPGGTDSRFFRAKGVPAYGFTPFVIRPEDPPPHANDERLSLEEFRRAIRILYRVLRRACAAQA